MTPRRRWLLVAAAAALLLAWWSWPHGDATGVTRTRHGRPTPAASARRAPSGPRATSPAPAFGAVKTGIAACDDYVARAIACDQLPDDAKIAIAEASKAWAETDAADGSALQASCRATASVQADALAAMGC